MDKNKRKTLIISSILTLLILIMIFLIIFVYFNYKKQQEINNNKSKIIINDFVQTGQDNTQKQYTEKDFTLKTNYIGENTWEYTITGELPNACYSATSDAIVMESYPEQVNINLQIEKVGDVCAQVIQDLNETGTFQASEQAQISLNVISD